MMEAYKKKALQLIVLFGFVSLFGDIVYEGARSVNGPYLGTLGANAALVGFIAGLGEFVGYAIRLISGYFSDKTKAYWTFTILGYGMLLSVPLLSLTGYWQMAAVLIVMERLGKALRSPAKDTIVSQATKQVGTGFGFGLQEAMDQIGAIAGPLIFAGYFVFTGNGQKNSGDYQHAYGLLWVPFFIVMACVVFAYIKVPHPEVLESSTVKAKEPDRLTKIFWLYTIFTFVTTLGFINFALLGFHFKQQNLMSDAEIPFVYAIAMGIDGAAALFFGRWYDILKARHKNEKGGIDILWTIPFFSLAVPAMAFVPNHSLAVASVLVWGIVMGIHETIMKAVIADITPLRKRGTGYGIFNTSYGLAVFIGSAVMGMLYDISLPLVAGVAVIAQLAAIPVFLLMKKEL